MSLLSRLFGSKGAQADAPVGEEYGGYRITAEPAREGTQFRLGARIDGEVDGETKTHHLIRADMFESRDAAVAASVAKAKQVIDEQGARLFS